MRSQLAERLGRQEPVISHLPPDVVSLAAAEEAIELADAYGICDGNPLAESQKITLRGALGERADGSWAATRVGDFGPRQGTGKNDKIATRELAGLILFGERLLIHTAHEFPTANESFLRLVAIFENYDDLRRKVKHIYYANGAQSIELLTGQRLLYKARTGGAGRGFAKADLVVYDEAQHLARGHLAASGPAKLANPNSQSWYAGSGGLVTSAVAWEMRRAAILGQGGRLAYTEATAEIIRVRAGKIVTERPDPKDLDAWYRAMPGLGRWVTEEGMQALADELGEDFSREGLCVWDPEPAADATWEIVTEASWSLQADPKHLPAGRLAYALDVDVNHKGEEWCSIGTSDGVHLEIVTPPEAGPGLEWVVPAVVAKKDRFDEILIDPSGPAGKLIQPLENAGITVRKVKPDEFVQACGQIKDAVIARTVWHIDQQQLTRAVAVAVSRDVGDGNWKMSRSLSKGDIAPFVAVTLAKWGAASPSDGPMVPVMVVT